MILYYYLYLVTNVLKGTVMNLRCYSIKGGSLTNLYTVTSKSDINRVLNSFLLIDRHQILNFNRFVLIYIMIDIKF